ncbi:otogelin [Nematolebias whitei]|uniref:otogelin n=1 Tax=Nematolebias whitei TaxID=451745 RepID=UPI0018984979|nr:otogelin [Nematolebias whitei]
MSKSTGVMAHDIEMFGNSWMEAEPHQGRCPMVPSGFSSPCARVDAQVLLEVEEVCVMLLDAPFQSCHDFVSPLSFMASCSNDLCRSGPSSNVVCQVFSEYARACAHADHPLHDWREHVPLCVKQCPLELQYRECISCCPESCNLERACIDSKLACLDGCYCPDGLIYEDGSCVTPAECPCEYHGMIYPSGQMLQEECNNCTCVGGVWNCTDYSCPGECSVTGDMYFQSFDGRIFTFPATCQYVLAKSRNSGKFTITIQNAPCGANLDGACIQSVNLVVDEDPRTEITLSHIGEVFMAGQYRVSLPYSDDVLHVQELSSMFLQVRTAFGLRLQYSWAEFRLYVQVDEPWKDDTVGLCGTFNGNIQDDFLEAVVWFSCRSPSGMIESTPQLFGNTWKVSSACSLSLSSPQLDPCDTHQQAVIYASEMCDVLNQELFSACHEYLSPAPFHQQCRADTCKCGTPCFCSALAHYARHCRRFSVVIDFRSHVSDCAVTCPATMQYGTCVSSCQQQCSFLSLPPHCGEDCEEGCTCPLGSFYNHRTHTCVHRSECPCSFLGADYEPGEVIMTSAGVQLCLDGKLVSQTMEGDRLCPPGQMYQNCSEREKDFLPSRGVACERTCESYLLNITCSAHEPCVSGCACPLGCFTEAAEGYRQSMQHGARVVTEVDVTWFYMNCLADTCACSRGGDSECFCISLAAYAQRCCHEGIPVDWRTPSLCPYDCEFYNKVLGKGPFRLFTFRDQRTLLSASRSSGFVFLQQANSSTTTAAGILSQFMMTPGLSRTRPHDSSRVSFEAAERPNYFLHVSPSGQVRLAKWEESEAFWDGATFVIHRNTWILGYDSLESHSKPGFFLHATLPQLHLLKFRHSYSFRRASLFRLTGPSPDTPPSPRCQWRYDPCVSPCFKTCSDPLAEACTTIPRVEACLPVCAPHMVLDEVTRRCVHVEDCIKVPVIVPLTTVGTASVTSATSTNITASATPTEKPLLYHHHQQHRVPLILSSLSKPPRHTTSKPTFTSSTSPAVATTITKTTMQKISIPESVVTTTKELVTTTHPPVPASSESSLTTAPTGATPSVATTTLRPVVLQPITEAKQPLTDRVQVSTKLTTIAYTHNNIFYHCTDNHLPDNTQSSASISVHTPWETTSRSAEQSPSLTATPMRMCTPPYAEIIDECTKYICVNNQLVLFNKSQSCPFTAGPPNCGLLGYAVLVNGDKCCPKWDCPCRCSMFPDLNVITFDGNSFAIFKAASYIMTQLSNETLSVLVQECPADSESPLKWNFTHLCLVSLNITHKSNHVVINRLQRRLYVNSRYAKPRFKKHGFEIYDTGNMYLIRSPSGLKVQWFHSTGMMVIDTDSLSKKLPTMGLCGFCDGDPTNDLTLPNGTTLGVSEALFTDSWQVANTTGYISYSRLRDHNCSTSDCSHCLAMLENPSFTPCHVFVPPMTFCEVWVRDSEYVNNQCVALAAYVASCHKFNICIEWRSPDYCPFACSDTLQYQACLPACTSQSCPNHDFDSDPDHCSGLTEGCVCPEGTLLHRPYSALCIPHEKCACTDGSGVPRAHGEVWTASKDGCCMYRCDNDTIVPVEFNCSSTPAPVCHRAGEMIISMADDTSCCPRKICVCNQSLCDQLPIECKYEEKMVSYYRSDSCCPEHVCVCQPYGCPQLTCPFGMSVVSVSAPSRCCPNQTCECSCEKIISPKCGLGEAAQLDRTFLSDPQNQCACKRYKCVREAVCVFGERGVLRPGQTLVEHREDGLCSSRQCSRSLDPTSGFYILRTSTVNCSAHCQPNQIYVPPKDQSMCCGACKNISCLYQHENGTTALYKPGKSWVSSCMKFDCTDTLFGPTLISYAFSCPPFNETECMKIGGTVVSYMDGCCKTCKEDGKSCQKVTVRMTIRKNDCRSNRPVNIVSCDGKCPSASIYNYNINTYARFCKCCRETGLQRRSVQLYCSSNSTWVSYTIQEPTDCSCQWS